MRRYLAAAATALSVIVVCVAVLAAPAGAARTVFQGQWLCDDRGEIMPLGGIELQLWRRGSPDFLPVEWVGGIDDRGFASPDGTFSLTATDPEDNHFVRMALRDAAGVRLKDWIGINDWSVDSGGYRNNVATQNLGGLLFSTPGQSHKCAVWRGLHLAHRDFRDLMGFNPPSGGLLIQADAPGETAFTPHTEIWWPAGFPVGWGGAGDSTITRHEFGHVIRHGYDGDAGHFIGDAVAHGYARSHTSCLRSNLGYAFNEGWAEFWAGDYPPAPSCPGLAPDDYTVEGNVGAALADIAARCYGGNRVPMVNILRANRLVIHSFQEFRAKVSCPVTLLLAPVAAAPLAPLTISAARRADLARAQVREIDRRLRGFRAQLRTAERLAKTQLECARLPCDAALRRALLPAALRTEIALAELLRRSADDADTAAEQTALAKLTIKQLTALNKANEKRTRVGAARISADGIQSALDAGRQVFAKDTSGKARRLRSQLVSRLASFRKVQRGGTAVTGLVLDQGIADRLRKVKARAFENPEPPWVPTPPIPIPAPPTPTPPPPAPTPSKQPSTLTVTCPASGKAGVYATGGTLSPAIAGATIELHVSRPNTPEVVVTTVTDANGGYSTGVALQTAATWTIFARWAGDANTLPDDSPSCQTVITP